MTYKIDGTALLLEPTEGEWADRQLLGVGGKGSPVYPAVREFQLRWGLMSPVEFTQISGFYTGSIQGTVTVDLPEFGNYTFKSHTGCVLQEPTVGKYFSEYYTDVGLLITNIR